MAGSYGHVAISGISSIENMGDAAECIEELYYLVMALAEDRSQIEVALESFYRKKRGEPDPDGELDVETVPSEFACLRAYEKAIKMMSR